MAFHVEGVHCTACLARIEGAAAATPGVLTPRLDMGRHVLEFTAAPEASLADLARRLHAMGYRMRPLPPGALEGGADARERRSMLVRAGVAAASAGNIMLLSTSLYSGADRSPVAGAFAWLTFVLFLPILFYSAVPFYRSAFGALRHRRASIDVPIVTALAGGTLLGLVHLLRGSGEVYFDSLAVLVALLLGSRTWLLSLQRRYLSPEHLSAFYTPSRVRVETPDGVVERDASQVRIGDVVVVERGERSGVDGQLLEGDVWVDASVLTGESRPRRRLAGQTLFAATRVVSGRARVRVTAVGDATRMGRLLAETERAALGRSPMVALADRAAQAISLGILAVGGVVALAWALVDPGEAARRALAVVILACPCALALATPMAQAMALTRASRRGAMVKSAEIFERIQRVRDVFFDKTGTLTHGELDIVGWWPAPPSPTLAGVVLALEEGVDHPVAHALVRALRERGAAPSRVRERTVVPGRGVEGVVAGRRWTIGAPADPGAVPREAFGSGAEACTVVALRDAEGRVALAAALGDRVRDDARDVVRRLERRGLRVHLVSGDAPEPARAVARAVGIAPDRVHAGMTPEAKRDRVAAAGAAMMVGDGVNDAVALGRAWVGVAVHGSMEASFRAADVYLADGGLAALADVVDLAHETMTVIRRTLKFSLAYNTVGGLFALAGHVTPLVAAVAMPASSATVVTMAVVGTRRWRELACARVESPAGGVGGGVDTSPSPGTAAKRVSGDAASPDAAAGEAGA